MSGDKASWHHRDSVKRRHYAAIVANAGSPSGLSANARFASSSQHVFTLESPSVESTYPWTAPTGKGKVPRPTEEHLNKTKRVAEVYDEERPTVKLLGSDADQSRSDDGAVHRPLEQAVDVAARLRAAVADIS